MLFFKTEISSFVWPFYYVLKYATRWLSSSQVYIEQEMAHLCNANARL